MCVRLVRPSQSVDKRSKQQRRDPRTFALFAFSLSHSLVLHVQQVPRDWEHIAKGTHCTFCFGPIQGQHAIWLFRQFGGGGASGVRSPRLLKVFPYLDKLSSLHCSHGTRRQLPSHYFLLSQIFGRRRPDLPLPRVLSSLSTHSRAIA